MKDFFKKNKVIIIITLIIVTLGLIWYFLNEKTKKEAEEKTKNEILGYFAKAKEAVSNAMKFYDAKKLEMSALSETEKQTEVSKLNDVEKERYNWGLSLSNSITATNTKALVIDSNAKYLTKTNSDLLSKYGVEKIALLIG